MVKTLNCKIHKVSMRYVANEVINANRTYAMELKIGNLYERQDEIIIHTHDGVAFSDATITHDGGKLIVSYKGQTHVYSSVFDSHLSGCLSARNLFFNTQIVKRIIESIMSRKMPLPERDLINEIAKIADNENEIHFDKSYGQLIGVSNPTYFYMIDLLKISEFDI